MKFYIYTAIFMISFTMFLYMLWLKGTPVGVQSMSPAPNTSKQPPIWKEIVAVVCMMLFHRLALAQRGIKATLYGNLTQSNTRSTNDSRKTAKRNQQAEVLYSICIGANGNSHYRNILDGRLMGWLILAIFIGLLIWLYWSILF